MGKQTKFDVSAFATLVGVLRTRGRIELVFANSREAIHARFLFYRWRKQEQAVNGDPTWLTDIVVRVVENRVVWSQGWANDTIREAMNQAGISIEEAPDATE